jgi:hypothetical protein
MAGMAKAFSASAQTHQNVQRRCTEQHRTHTSEYADVAQSSIGHVEDSLRYLLVDTCFGVGCLYSHLGCDAGSLWLPLSALWHSMRPTACRRCLPSALMSLTPPPPTLPPMYAFPQLSCKMAAVVSAFTIFAASYTLLSLQGYCYAVLAVLSYDRYRLTYIVFCIAGCVTALLKQVQTSLVFHVNCCIYYVVVTRAAMVPASFGTCACLINIERES